MADESFIQKLRMNNIFPEHGNPTPLIGMPDFYSGRRPQFPMQQPQQQPALAKIAQQMTKPIVPPAYGQVGNEIPMQNTAYLPPESDKYATNILMGSTAKDKDRDLKGQIAVMKNTNDTAKTSVLQAKQKLAEKVAAGKATDEEKQQYALDLEDEKQSGRMSLQGAKSDTQYGIQGMRSNDAYGLQDVKGTQALEQIGARVAGQKDINDNKPTTLKPLSSAANKMDTRVKAQELMTTRPDLAQFVTIGDNGSVQINPNTPLNELSMIQAALYPKTPQNDINLPSSNTKTTDKTKTSTTTAKPSAADLIKKYGG